jgi:hypothetical protein
MLRILRLVLPFIPGGAIVEGATAAAEGASIVSAVVKFFTTPVGKVVGFVLIGLALYIAGDWHRASADRAERAAEVAAAAAKAAERDAEIRKQVSAEAASQIAAIRQEADGLKQKVADYETALAAHGEDTCRVTPDDARRLRKF